MMPLCNIIFKTTREYNKYNINIFLTLILKTKFNAKYPLYVKSTCKFIHKYIHSIYFRYFQYIH